MTSTQLTSTPDVMTGDEPDRVLFSCVSENGPAWFHKVYNLVLSLRLFGGTLAQAPVVVNFVDAVDGSHAAALQQLGADVRIVKRFDARSPYLNKLRMLELADEYDFDVLVALDCDVLIAGDLDSAVSTGDVRVKPEDIAVLTDAQWEALYQALDLPVPSIRVTATSSGARMYPYFNSGVMIVPARTSRDLLNVWTSYVDAMYALFDSGWSVIPPQWRFHLDQYSLACALLSGGLPWSELPVSLNFPVHIPVHPSLRDAAKAPFIIHYHKRIDANGFVFKSDRQDFNALIDELNHERAHLLGLEYSGLSRAPAMARIRRVAVRTARRTGLVRR